MQPIHSVEYELTTELATEIHRCLLCWELRRGRWQDLPVYLGGLIFTVLILCLGLQGWILPAVGGGLLCVVVIAFFVALFRRRWAARTAVATALLALHAPDRRVRIEFAEDRLRLETEFFRGEGAPGLAAGFGLGLSSAPRRSRSQRAFSAADSSGE